MQKKILALIMACAMIIGLASCGKSVSGEDNSAASNGAATSQPTEAYAEDVYKRQKLGCMRRKTAIC